MQVCVVSHFFVAALQTAQTLGTNPNSTDYSTASPRSDPTKVKMETFKWGNGSNEIFYWAHRNITKQIKKTFAFTVVWAWHPSSPLWPYAWGRAGNSDPGQFGRRDVRRRTANLRHYDFAQRCDCSVRGLTRFQIRGPQLRPEHVQEGHGAHDDGQKQIRVSHVN